jgi:hypothetical protein
LATGHIKSGEMQHTDVALSLPLPPGVHATCVVDVHLVFDNTD